MGSSVIGRALICRGLAGLVAISLFSVAPAQNQGFAEGSAPYIRIRLVRAKEIRGASVIVREPASSSTTTVTANVLALTFRYMTGPDVVGSASVEGGGGGAGGVAPPSEESSLVESESARPDPGGGNPGGGQGNENYWIRIPDSIVAGGNSSVTGRMGFLASPSNAVQPFTYVSTNFATTPPSQLPGEPGLRVRIDPGQEVTVCYFRPFEPILPSALGRIIVTKALTMGTFPVTTSLTHEEVHYDLNRRDGFGDASVTTRKGYGQPNRDGQFPGDPNADLRNLNFGDWIFRGGMFVGNMPNGTGDRSGQARAQLFAPTVPSLAAPRMTVFTAFQWGRPTNINGGMTIGLFGTFAGGPESESTATWDTRFNITPGSTAPPIPFGTPETYPLLKFVLGGSEGDSLLSGSITRVFDVGTPNPSNPVLIDYTTHYRTWRLSGLALALHEEGSLVDWGWQGWRYIASKEYFPSLPSNHGLTYRDTAPRIWNIYVANSHNWMETLNGTW